MRPKQKQLK
jgi:large subunit ribosomal protein L24